MGMPTDPLLDIMRRSMANLRFVEARAGPNGPYETTQLINTFLGALAHPFEAMRHDLTSLPLDDAAARGWPTVAKEYPTDRDPTSLGDLIRLMRNGLAHGNLDLIGDGQGNIKAVRVWNVSPRLRARDWGTILSLADMRRFLDCFVRLIEDRHRDFGWYARPEAA